ncbi:hypothetical protein GCK32_018390 [Trichostrongylus colubriformis]|uniref:DNA2/NAM7 helicase helicase domain-containing protein n=1 Tax=Trichostrongylus colubriformis TaxID=6319 RepID=A0AAN8FLC1_TRICO
MARARIHRQWYDFSNKIVRVELFVDTRTENQFRDAILYNGILLGDSSAEVRVCVRLTRAVTGTDPVFEILASENLFSALDPNARMPANDILDQVYGGRDRPSRARSPPPPDDLAVVLRGRRLYLRPDQARAVRMGMEEYPIMAIQAAYGTGKTVVGAVIAARLAQPGRLVIATATTNVAIAQFTDTLLGLDEYDHLPVLRNPQQGPVYDPDADHQRESSALRDVGIEPKHMYLHHAYKRSEGADNHQLQELWVARDHSRLVDHFESIASRSADSDSGGAPRLPPWVLNYDQRILLVGDDAIPILAAGAVAPSPQPAREPDTLDVRAATTVVLPPVSETMVQCQVARPSSDRSTMLVEGSLLSPDNLFVAPAVSSVNNPRLMISNPSNTPKVLYKNQQLTKARPVVELPNGTILDLYQRF